MEASEKRLEREEPGTGVKTPYIDTEFAARKQEIELVGNRLQSARKRVPDQRLLVEFFGVVGLGKSWLLERLSRVYSPDSDPPVVSALISFEELHREQDWRTLLGVLFEQISPYVDRAQFERDLEDKALERSQLSRRFVDLVRGLGQKYTPLLLFDASERSSELRGWLEDDIVHPLLRTNSVVFVFAGRSWLRWKRFEVRERVQTFAMEPFDPRRDVPEMLENLGIERSLLPDLYQYAFGHPLTTRVIIDARRQAGERWRADKEEIISDAVYKDVIGGYFFQGLEEHLRFLLQVVSIIRKFDSTFLKAIASRFEPKGREEYKARPGGFYSDAIREMQDIALVQWNSNRGGYILAPVLRWIIAKNLWMRDKDAFQRWHWEAVEEYNEYIKAYPGNAINLLLERVFHQAWALRAEGKTEDEIADQTSADFVETWDSVSRTQEVQWDLPQMLDAFPDKVRGDEELVDFFPEVHDRLLRQVQAVREPVF